MNPSISTYARHSKSFHRKFAFINTDPRPIITAFMAALLFLTACSLLNRSPSLGDAAELQTQAMLTCSAACAARGQCGTIPDGTQVVLGGQSGPLVENHERLFPVNSAVSIIENRLETVQTVATGELFELRFYHIQPPDRLDGWVAGWCLAEQ